MVANRARHGVFAFLLSIALAAASHAAGTPSANFEWLQLDPPQGTGAPVLTARGALRPGGDVVIGVNAGAGQYCALIFGADASVPGTPVAGGELFVQDIYFTVAVVLNGAGDATVTFPISEAPPSAYVQAVTIDPSGKFRFSNTLGTNRGHQWVVDTTPLTWSGRTGHGVAVLNDRMYVVAGRPTSQSTNDVHRFDGVKWVQLLGNDPGATNRFSPRHQLGLASHAGRLWAGFGYSTLGYEDDLWSSTDGKTWTQVSADLSQVGGPGPRSNTRMVSFNGKLWVIGGYYKASPTQKPTTLFLNDVWSYDSASGAWSKSIAPWKGREDHGVVVHGGRMYVIGGSSVANDSIPYNYVRFNDVWSTADGKSWKQETSAAEFLPMIEHVTVSFQGELQLFGGYQNTFNYQWRSVDGRDWTVPLELGGPGYSFGNKPVASAAKDAMPDIVRYDSVGVVFRDRVWSLGGFSVNQTYNHVVYTD